MSESVAFLCCIVCRARPRVTVTAGVRARRPLAVHCSWTLARPHRIETLGALEEASFAFLAARRRDIRGNRGALRICSSRNQHRQI